MLFEDMSRSQQERMLMPILLKTLQESQCAFYS